jgi:MFS family permease
VAVTVSMEIPIFYFSEQILNRFSPFTLLVVAHVAYAVRVFGYTLITASWQVLLLEPLHGVTYACYAMSSVTILARFAPANLQSSTQGVKSVAGRLGSLTGSIFGGWVMQKYGASAMYRGGGTAVIVSAVAVLCFHKFVQSVSGDAKGAENTMLGVGATDSESVDSPELDEAFTVELDDSVAIEADAAVEVVEIRENNTAAAGYGNRRRASYDEFS